MTSNVGSTYIQDWDGNDFPKLENTLHAELGHHFRPEFLNRIDDIVIFDRIKQEDMEHIVETMLASMLTRIKQTKNITLTFTDTAKRELAKRGYDPAFGARPLRRVIKQYILDELAKKIIDSSINEGDSVSVDYDGKKFVPTVQ